MKGTPEQQKLIQRIADTIVKEYEPDAIVLFGSFAWGEPTRDSDLDLLVIKDDPQPYLKRTMLVRKLLRDILEMGLDLMILRPGEIKQHLKEKHSFLELVWQEGEFIYGSP